MDFIGDTKIDWLKYRWHFIIISLIVASSVPSTSPERAGYATASISPKAPSSTRSSKPRRK